MLQPQGEAQDLNVGCVNITPQKVGTYERRCQLCNYELQKITVIKLSKLLSYNFFYPPIQLQIMLVYNYVNACCAFVSIPKEKYKPSVLS